MYEILLVEDDRNLALQLKQAIEKYEFKVNIINDLDDVANEALSLNPALIIMDINLGSQDGFYWTQQIRMQSNVPIIFLSSRDNKLDQVIALTYGGDDYLVKPVEVELLIIKIKALLRRAYDYKEVNTDLIIVDEYALDTEKLELTYQDNKIELSKNEFKILQKLMQDSDRYVTRYDLMDYLWDNQSFIDDNAFNVNLSRLRKKVQTLNNEEMIQTKRSVGYRFGRN